MEILFGIHFDQGYYLDISLLENQNSFNKIITGPLGLLGLLSAIWVFQAFHDFLREKVKFAKF